MALPPSVLSLQTNALVDVDGQEALAALLTLSLKGGKSLFQASRLENITERLWHRANSSALNYRPPTPMSDFSTSLLNSGGQVPHRSSTTHTHRACVGILKQDVPLGRVIINVLSQELMAFDPPSISLKNELLTQKLESQPSLLPTPSSEPAESDTLPNIQTTEPAFNQSPGRHRVVPSVCLPSTPPDSDHATTCPQLVVVNPTPNLTPNPTPHPTPPATPVLLASQPSFVQSTHLLPSVPQPNPSLSSALSPSVTPRATSAPPPPLLPAASLLYDRLSEQHSELIKSPRHLDTSLKSPTSPVTSTTGHSDGEGSICSIPQETTKTETRRPVRAARKGKGYAPTRKARAPPLRRAATMDSAKPLPKFNIGSSSSTGSKFTETSKSASKGSTSEKRVSLPPPPKPLTAVAPPPPAALDLEKHPEIPAALKPNGRRIELASTSSDYSDTEEEGANDSWASEDLSAEDIARAQEKSRLLAAAEEAKRQRKMFEKVPVPTQPAILARTRSGLLSQLMNPDPNRFPTNHPFRIQSSADLSQLPRNGAATRPSLTLQKSKSSAAVAVAAPVVVSPTVPRGGLKSAKSPISPLRRGPPQNVELEDETDSEDGNDNELGQGSVAEEKLAKLIGKRSTLSKLVTAPAPSPKPVQSSEPIPLGHPYNLPVLAAPSTPRTTRRQMLATELSESLRRQLLWQRQVDKVNVANRRKSGGTFGLTTTAATTTNVVQVSARTGDRSTSSNGQQQDQEDPKRGSQVARHRSWVVDDYRTHW